MSEAGVGFGPFAVKEIEHEWVPMQDGTRLSARMWLPEGVDGPVPAILEYIPYRKRDGTRQRDVLMHPWFASHGYAAIRVDMRGSGESEGVLLDEYLAQEQADGLDVLRWIGEQPWCSGSVGIIGISWGGFNGLQIAAHRPKELKAVVSVASTDDRYADDVHYMGGCLLGDNLSWGSVMFAYNSLPPDPAIVGEGWREMWRQRLEQSGLWVEQWLKHQRRDAYWRHGSICEDYGDIECPVLLASGWADGYSNAVFRMLEYLDVPRQGLIGPWAHRYPFDGEPGPAVGFLQHCKRFWDRWLKGDSDAWNDEPQLIAYIQDSIEPTTSYQERPGRWAVEPRWPTPEIEQHHFLLQDSDLIPGSDGEEAGARDLQSPLSVGLFAGKWCSYASTPDLPHDQRQEDGGAMVFETAPLEEDVEILGAGILRLSLEVDQPVAQVAARLSDVRPDGKATRVTYGLLNLTHRDSDERPAPMTPGERYRVTVQLNEVGQRIPAGHRIRIALSTSYWPLAWPPPRPVKMHVVCGASELSLPFRRPRGPAHEHEFEPVEIAPPLPVTQLGATEANWLVLRDLGDDVSTLRVIKDEGRLRLEDIGTVIEKNVREDYTYEGDDFGSVVGEVIHIRGLEREGWSVKTRTRTVLRSDEERFYIHAELDAWENGRRVYSNNWDRCIKRDLV